MSAQRRVAVIGGGISGLAAANRLLELDPTLDVTVFEAGSHAGGLIRTTRRDGFVLEHGPDSMITDKPWGLDLARRLGLTDELVGTRSENRRSFVVCKGKLEPVPEGFQLLAPSRWDTLAASRIFSWCGKARMALDLCLPRRTDGKDESLGEFVTRRLGREALERMAQPMIAGIYGADPMQLSLKATMPRFVEMEREHGSVIRGMLARAKSNQAASNGGSPADGKGVSGARYGLFVSFRRGMQTVIDALEQRLGDRIQLNSPATHLKRDGILWRVYLGDGREIEAEAVILALPAYRAAALIKPTDTPVSALLEEIPYAGAGTMTLCYRREDIPHPLDGFGFVVPAIEHMTLLGCTFSRQKWPDRTPEGFVLLRGFLGDSVLRGPTEPELVSRVREDFRKLLGITVPPEFVHFWQAERCMPHYLVGHLDRVAAIEERMMQLPGLELAGNAYHGVGIPDSVHSGQEAAERVHAALTSSSAYSESADSTSISNPPGALR